MACSGTQRCLAAPLDGRFPCVPALVVPLFRLGRIPGALFRLPNRHPHGPLQHLDRIVEIDRHADRARQLTGAGFSARLRVHFLAHVSMLVERHS